MTRRVVSDLYPWLYCTQRIRADLCRVVQAYYDAWQWPMWSDTRLSSTTMRSQRTQRVNAPELLVVRAVGTVRSVLEWSGGLALNWTWVILGREHSALLAGHLRMACDPE
jgi:hypothetical protein